MPKVVYDYFKCTADYHSKPDTSKHGDIEISKFDIIKYARMNGVINGRRLSYDAVMFYGAACNMALVVNGDYYVISDDYRFAETSYKTAISFAMGMLATRIVAAEKYGISKLFHLRDDQIKAGKKKGDSLPDWFGLKGSDAYLFESKGTVDRFKKRLDLAKKQTENVSKIEYGGKNYIKFQKNVIVSCFDRTPVDNAWHIHDIDPELSEGMTLEINIDEECFEYYNNYIESFSRCNSKEIKVNSCEFICFEYLDERHCILKGIYDCVKSGNYTKDNKYSNFDNEINKVLEDLKKIGNLEFDASNYADGILVSNTNVLKDE